MKTLLVIICLCFSTLVDAQIINWKKFDDKALNGQVFIRLNDYTRNKGNYTIVPSFSNEKQIHRYIVSHNAKYSPDKLSSNINKRLPENYTGIIDAIYIKEFIDKKYDITYQDLANKCIVDWVLSPSDSFFLLGYGKEVVTTSFYNKKTKTVYISVVFIK